MHTRLLALLLPALLAVACTAQLPTPTPTPTHTAQPSSSATPTAPQPPTPTGSLQPPPSGTPTDTPSPSTPPPTATPIPSPGTYEEAALVARLERILARQHERFGMVGLGAAVVMPDGFAWSDGAGLASVSPEIPVEGDTPFVVGSITKTFIAALVMQLDAEGVLSLDDALVEWLPDYTHHNDATLRQLLAHTSGIFNYFEHPEYSRRVFGDPSHQWTPEEIVTELAAPPYFPAGTSYHYSNTGFVLLGMVIERATGSTLDEQLSERVLEPLGLDDTSFGGTRPPRPNSAHGYLVGPGGTPRLINDGSDFRPTRSAATVAWAAGSMVASAPDLAVWARALYDGDVVGPDQLAQMTDFAANPYSGLAYGLGTRTRFLDGRQMVGHTGSLRGFAAAMWHFQAEDITVVVLSNRGRVDVNPVADALARAAMEAVGYLP